MTRFLSWCKRKLHCVFFFLHSEVRQGCEDWPLLDWVFVQFLWKLRGIRKQKFKNKTLPHKAWAICPCHIPFFAVKFKPYWSKDKNSLGAHLGGGTVKSILLFQISSLCCYVWWCFVLVWHFASEGVVICHFRKYTSGTWTLYFKQHTTNLFDDCSKGLGKSLHVWNRTHVILLVLSNSVSMECKKAGVAL